MASKQPRWEYLEDPDDSRDYARELITWLSDKGPDVWQYVSRQINWDNGEAVIDWVVSQPECHLANASEVFWNCDPIYYLSQPERGAEHANGAAAILHKTIKTANADGYGRNGTAARFTDLDVLVSRYQEAERALRDGVAPFRTPPEYLAEIKGREPRVPDNLKAENNRQLRECLNALGSAIHSAEELAWLKKNRPKTANPQPTSQPQLTRASRITGISLITFGVTVLVILAVIEFLV